MIDRDLPVVEEEEDEALDRDEDVVEDDMMDGAEVPHEMCPLAAWPPIRYMPSVLNRRQRLPWLEDQSSVPRRRPIQVAMKVEKSCLNALSSFHVVVISVIMRSPMVTLKPPREEGEEEEDPSMVEGLGLKFVEEMVQVDVSSQIGNEPAEGEVIAIPVVVQEMRDFRNPLVPLRFHEATIPLSTPETIEVVHEIVQQEMQ